LRIKKPLSIPLMGKSLGVDRFMISGKEIIICQKKTSLNIGSLSPLFRWGLRGGCNLWKTIRNRLSETDLQLSVRKAKGFGYSRKCPKENCILSGELLPGYC